MYRIKVWKPLCSGNFKAMSKLSPLNWPVVRQVKRGDLFGRDKSTQSAKSENLHGRTVEADK